MNDYKHLENPVIAALPTQKMMEISVTGNPSEVLPGAYGALFQVYFGMRETPKGPKTAAPRLRCAIPEPNAPSQIAPNADFEAVIGLPVPDSVKALPPLAAQTGFDVRLAQWSYGEAAEILHRGPYDREEPAIKKLLEYAASEGYEPAGVHEEEYIVGPGTPGATPENYVTIIRYPVKRSNS